MALVTNYATLQTWVATLLNRSGSNFTADVPNFIQQFESDARDNSMIRKLTDRGDVSISTDSLALPSDLEEIEAWYHNGDTIFDSIDIVSASQIPVLKARFGSLGAPRYAAITDKVARFAPAPDGTYTTQLTYWREIPSLSDSVTTNWLLDERPDIYIYGTALEAAPYLKNDKRIAVWEHLLDKRIENLHLATERERYGGSLIRQVTPIG